MMRRNHVLHVIYFTLPFAICSFKSSFAQEMVEERAAKVCAGLMSQSGNFQGTLQIDDVTAHGNGNGTVTFSKKGVNLGSIQSGTYAQYQSCLIAVIKLISPPPAPPQATFRTCTLPEFGQTGWDSEELLPGASGWRGGGYNQDAFCTDFKNSIISSRRLTGTFYSLATVGSSEEGRWTGGFNRKREYNYHCTLKLLTNPRYNERKDERCGILE